MVEAQEVLYPGGSPLNGRTYSQIADMLEKKVIGIFEDMQKLKVIKTKEKGNVEIRQMWEGDKSLSICEVK